MSDSTVSKTLSTESGDIAPREENADCQQKSFEMNTEQLLSPMETSVFARATRSGTTAGHTIKLNREPFEEKLILESIISTGGPENENDDDEDEDSVDSLDLRNCPSLPEMSNEVLTDDGFEQLTAEGWVEIESETENNS